MKCGECPQYVISLSMCRVDHNLPPRFSDNACYFERMIAECEEKIKERDK